MIRSHLALLLAAGLGLARAAPAVAQESLDDLPSAAPPAGPDARSEGSADLEGKALAEINGYLSNRLSFTQVDVRGPLPARDQPAIGELVEANAQVRVNLSSRRYFVQGDLSLAYRGGWLYYAADERGARRRVDAPDGGGQRPFFVPSELYLSLSPRPWLNAVVGKKRVTWGSGFAFNPMDLVSPAKDPTDPTSQRAGAWLARVEAPFEHVTFSALFAPQELLSQSGLPYALMKYPDPRAAGADDALHYLAAARAYLLVANTDLNVVYYFSNRYHDELENTSRLGLSASRFVLGDLELHLELLLSTGSGRRFPDPACASSPAACSPAGPFAATKARSRSFFPRMVLGSRWQITQESYLSLEYYFQGDGYSDAEFADAVALLDRANRAGQSLAGPSQSDALPQRYSFDPLRRHYLIASYSSPRFFDDWIIGASVIAGLRDLSGLVSLSASWNALEWLTVSAYAYAPIRGLGVGEAKIGGRSYSEYALQPFDARYLVEVRAFY